MGTYERTYMHVYMQKQDHMQDTHKLLKRGKHDTTMGVVNYIIIMVNDKYLIKNVSYRLIHI